MESAIRWLKASFMAGAVADGLTGILMLLPGRMGEAEFRYPMGLGASLMFGWTALLLWGYRRPMERKGILLITMPVIVGLVATGLWAASAGHFSVPKILPGTITGCGICALMGYSYRRAAIAEKLVDRSGGGESG